MDSHRAEGEGGVDPVDVLPKMAGLWSGVAQVTELLDESGAVGKRLQTDASMHAALVGALPFDEDSLAVRACAGDGCLLNRAFAQLNAVGNREEMR